ncbi:hypothetical protein NP493_43g02028 [Ridgeia piscesae]|uniref:Protein RIC1 homolog n=1 Tax=Ridgeia piscesae TaxID=27915 RepID=A0AAD9UJJ2_RIDPI|nr:hypothetical protein NP493_43g02028 [Ridgeia piscesae]
MCAVDIQTVCGAVSVLRWTPDGCAIALAWEKGGFSIWSVFGTLLLHSMGVESSSSLCEDLSRNPLLHIISMEWGCEGYHLWMVSDKPKEALSSSECKHVLPRLLQLQFVKAAVSVNPCVKNYEHLFLQGEEKLYLNPEDPSSVPRNNANNNTTAPPMTHSSAAFLVGSKQWQVVPIPHIYLVHNWPIRFSAVNTSGHCVAVAGKTGLAHYTLFSRKWKLFGNETQEQDMMVTGGLTWWKDFICAACYNLLDQRDEIRFYPRDSKLDNTFAHIERVPSQIMLLNTFRDILIMLCADSHIMIFRLERKNMHPNPGLVIHKLQEVSIGNFIPHPATVASISLTSLRTETASMKSVPQPNEAESIMLNVAGRLLMFQRDRSSAQAKPKEGHDRPLPFCAPVVVASSVENMWSCSRKNDQRPHLTEALWLSCGAAGMKVWLPLLPREGSTRGFMSKRIMLPFHVDIYPVALLFEAGIILGASSESVCYRSMRVIEEDWPYLQLERTSQVYLHHVLRKLLRRNLGVHALEIAGSCTDMPHFRHVLELLVHEVLEEEATSKDPIPDPLLPRVMAFVQEFPEFLQTVVHCARKTEVALWQYLFATVGNPKDLFEECVKLSQLETAASYLIILQNLEKLSVAHEYATMLLDAALEKCQWELARDLVRFLRSIDPKEADSPNPGAKKLSTGSAVYPATFTTPPSSPDDAAMFKYTGPMRSRSVSMSKEDVAAGVTPKEKVRQSKTDPQSVTRCRSISQKDDVVNSDTFFIDTILSRHARKLLASYRLRDLAFFAANMEDYQLVSWLRIERLRAARVEDFVSALKALHSDFHWPLPILSLTSLRSVSSMNSLSRSESLLDDGADLNGASGCSLGPHSPTSNNRLAPQLGSPVSSTSTAEVMLQRRSTDDWSHATTEQSDTSSALGDLDNSDMSCADSSDILCLSVLDQLSQELANKGPAQSEVELRYLFQIVLEAGCLEWALLIAIVLRDTMATVRTVNTASMTDTPIEIVGRMREGLSFLELWADTECFGYKPFLQSIQTQSKQLQSLVQENPPRSRMSLPKRLSIISVDGSLPTDPIPSPKAESCDGSDSEKRPSLEDGAPENSLGRGQCSCETLRVCCLLIETDGNSVRVVHTFVMVLSPRHHQT